MNPQLELEFKIPLSVIHGTSRGKLIKDINDWNTINQFDLIQNYKTHHSTGVEYMFF